MLDEIGRGTATFDGLSIAWAVAEYIATNPRSRPKTLFATHYHELTDLADAFGGVVNFHVAAREWKDDIIFLHKILAGRSDRSYGIQVARLAGLPASVIARARDILASLEQDELTRGGKPTISGAASSAQQQLGLVPDGRARRTRNCASGFARSTSTGPRRLMRFAILEELKKETSTVMLSAHEPRRSNDGASLRSRCWLRVRVALLLPVAARIPGRTSSRSPC